MDLTTLILIGLFVWMISMHLRPGGHGGCGMHGSHGQHDPGSTATPAGDQRGR